MKLLFGTGGIRATMGNREDQLNQKTIQMATLGVAGFAKKTSTCPKVAIAYDSRLNSESFARETACVLASQGCEAHIYPTLMPTPALSFAVRYLSCDMGICITASHNPSEYNGFKVYGADGCQVTTEVAEGIQKEIEIATEGQLAHKKSYEDYRELGNIQEIDAKVMKAFLGTIGKKKTKESLKSDLKVVYTPLHGAGLICVTSILKYIGLKDLTIVAEQAKPNGKFPTCPYPNPEEKAALKLGLEYCKKIKADILLATDPDSDRVGVAAKKGDEYVQLSGNQVGVLLFHYLLECRKAAGTMPINPVVIKTIVTTGMVEEIAKDYGVEVISTLTGFKYIGEQIGELEKKGEKDRFIFGFEESCGYLFGDYVRDKDAVGAAMLIVEMADYYKSKGKTIWEAMEYLYRKYGRFETTLQSYEFQGEEAKKRMNMIREGLKTKPNMKMDESKVVKYIDYLYGDTGLPKSDVLVMWLENKSKVVIRPSGTEPKIKIYTESC